MVTSDLGAGEAFPKGMGCDTVGGDQGKLQNTPRDGNCTPPSDAFISYNYETGETNIPGGSGDAVDNIKDAFKCIAKVGTKGCGYEHQLEAARRAPDPTLNLNPGFLRPDALLAVVFITDEDDCSAQNQGLFDPTNTTLGNPDSFRCFAHGTRCDGNDPTRVGLHANCRPGGDYLYGIERYTKFFTETIKRPGRVLAFAIAGPTDRVEVGRKNTTSGDKVPDLMASCRANSGKGAPGIRIKHFIDGFGGNGFFNTGKNEAMTTEVPVNICSSDFTPALRQVGDRIRDALGNQCMSPAPLTKAGGLACNKGDNLGQGKTCAQSCLHDADCIVDEVVNQGSKEVSRTRVPRCDKAAFDNPASKDCGGTCPCWRMVAAPDKCDPATAGSPYAVEVLRKGEAPKGAVAVAKCSIIHDAWGSAAFAAMPQCGKGSGN